MNNMAIGVFDSGVGGLSCVKELINVVPCENIKYLGDTLRMPYGVKTIEELKIFANNNVSFLQRRNVKLIAAACGTVSSNVLVSDITSLSVPFVDVIMPTVNSALKMSKSKRIGIIATPATIKAGSIEKKLMEIDPSCKIIAVGCADFVPLIETGHIYDDTIRESANIYLKQIKDFNVDTLILGCTHYPIISQIITEIIGADVFLINSGKETAFEIKRVLKSLNLLNSEKEQQGSAEFFVTASPENFDNVAKIFLGEELNVNAICCDIED